MTIKESVFYFGALVFLASWFSGDVRAADITANSSTTSGSNSGALDEIVVTAEKREQTLSSVGASVTAFSGDTLEKLGVRDIADLAEQVPGFTVQQTQLDAPVYTLRGVGFYNTTLGIYPAVSVYVDEVPLPFPVLTSHGDLDVNRVEILKGPQGILFGQSATGGAINYVANKPTKDFTAGTTLTYGNFSTFDGAGYLSGPLTDELSARLSLHVINGDGWQQSYTRPGDTLGAPHLIQGRLALQWQPSEGLTALFNFSAWQDTTQPQAPQLTKVVPQVPAYADPDLLTYPLAPHNNRAADWSPTIGTTGRVNSGDRDFEQASAKVNYEVSDSINLTSITSYIHYHMNDYFDTDGTTLNIQDLHSLGTLTSFVQELRAANSGSARLRWLVGGNFERDSADEDLSPFYADASTGKSLGIDQSTESSDQVMNNYAVFGNMDFDLLKTLTLKAGARYTRNDRKFTGCDRDSGNGSVAGFFTYLRDLLSGDTTQPPIAPGACVTLNSDLVAGLYRTELNQNNVSYRVGADWKPVDGVLAYANISKAYKPGSFPNLDGATTAQYQPVVQESLLDYEVGVKTTFLDRSLYLDLSVFHYDYTDKQLTSEILDPVFGLLDALVNIPKSRVNGFDGTATWRREGLAISASGAYLDAKIESFTGYNNAGSLQDFAGSSMPYSPKWSGALNSDYQFPINSNWVGSVGAGLTYSASTNSDIGAPSDFRIPSYTLLNLRASVAPTNGKWSVMIWGKNVTDRYYVNNVIREFDVINSYTGMPATYGVTFNMRY